LKSGSHNLLEPSGPVQACNGIALPFYLLRKLKVEGSTELGGQRRNTYMVQSEILYIRDKFQVVV